MTHVSEYPAGTRFAAGLGVSTVLPDLDFETYSAAGYVWLPDTKKWTGPPGAPKNGKGLGVVGVAVYAEHPSTEILSLSYNLKDGRGVRRWRPGMALPYDLIEHVRAHGLLEAWNSGFEWWIWNLVAVPRHGFPPLNIWQLRCAMAKARANGYPGKLAAAGSVMGLQIQKDAGGDALLKLFSMPQTPTKANGGRTRIRPEDDPEKAEKLYSYNDTDIATEAEASAHCPDLEGEELDFWLADQLINRRGVHIDAESLRACAAIVSQCLERFDAELCALTGGQVERASQLERLKGWLSGQGVYMADGPGAMDDDAITARLAKLPPHPPGAYYPARRALELRQLVGSASVKKVFAMNNQLSSWNRLHDLFNYHGARTGRPTGEGPQPTNLPKAGPPVYKCVCGKYHGTHAKICPWCSMPVAPRKRAEWTAEAVEDCLSVIRTKSLEAVQWFYGDAMLAVSGCLRGLYTAAPGYDLIASDFSAIESVVTAALAGEDWRMDMFHTHGKNYEMAAAQISGIPFAEVMAHAGYDVNAPEWWTKPATGPHHPTRQTLGKVSELASGFGGWVGAWVKFGADAFLNEDEIKKAILAWRAANPAIVEFWGGQERRGERWGMNTPELFGLEGMAIAAVLNPETPYPVMRKDGSHTGITYVQRGDALFCILPSGRAITYRKPRLDANTRGFGGAYSLAYEGWNSNPTAGPMGWVSMSLYGGKLCENVVQAVARDIQRRAILNLERAGYAVVLHVYDEDVAEVPENFGSVEGLEALMQAIPEWATYKGRPWPIKAAGGWRGKRYRKG